MSCQKFGCSNILLIGGNGEQGVSKFRNLLLNCGNNAGVCVTDCHNSNACAHINQLVTVYVLEDRAVGALNEYRKHRSDTRGNNGGSALLKLYRLGSWDRR